MTIYFGLWRINTTIPPPQDPRMELQQYLAFQAMLKQQLESGDLKEVNSFLEGGSGYFISGDITEEKIHANLIAFSPYVTFELHRTLPTTKSLELAINVSRARAAAMKIPA
jgi:hypothetical protein